MEDILSNVQELAAVFGLKVAPALLILGIGPWVA